MVFGERIKQLRIEHQWTQEYVCEKLNISAGALSRYETGMYEPKSLALVKEFSILFNVSTDYLIGKTNERDTSEYNTPEVRAIARDVSNLSPENRELFKNLLKQMSDKANEAKK